MVIGECEIVGTESDKRGMASPYFRTWNVIVNAICESTNSHIECSRVKLKV